jgi:hypothetical protein
VVEKLDFDEQIWVPDRRKVTLLFKYLLTIEKRETGGNFQSYMLD